MSSVWQDVRFGLRLIKGNPGFAAVAALTLALGVAAAATVFSWIDNLLVRPYPGATDSQRLAGFESVIPGAPNGGVRISYLELCDYRKNLQSLAGLTAHDEDVFSLGDDGDMQAVWGELVSGDYFQVLGVKPALGRVFTAEENGDELGAYPVAVISHRLWRSRYRGDPFIVGKMIRVNRRALTVAGVAAEEFRGTQPGLAFDIWVPVTMGVELGMRTEASFRDRGRRTLYALARLKPGVSVEQARAEAAAFASSQAQAYPNTNRGVSAIIVPLWRLHNGAPELLRGALRILAAAALLMLFIVCANVANLLLSRSVARQRELAVRLAMGAGRWRLSRQMFTETALLAGAGALLGLPLAVWASEVLPWLVPRIGVSVAAGFDLNGRVLAFTVLICAGAALLAGAAPVALSLRTNVNETLKEGGRSGSAGAHSHRARNALVIGEMALAAVGLVGAGLFLKSFHAARNIYPGFDQANVLLARFFMGSSGFTAQEARQFASRLKQRMEGAAGVVSVSYADYAPLGSNAGPWAEVGIEGYQPARGEYMNVNRYLIAPEYFKLMRTPLAAGREFTDADGAGAAPVVIVNETFARKYFHGGYALGRKVRRFGQWATVVGVARDSKYFDVAEAPRPHFFTPFEQNYQQGDLYFYVRTAGDPVAAMAPLRRAVAEVDSRAGAFSAMPLTEWTGVTLLPQKIAAVMLVGLAALSLALAAVGLYSVMAYTVTQRTHEIGVRMAMGARPADILRDVVRRGLLLAAAGLAAGLAAAFAATRLAASLLVNTSPADPATFAGTAAFLTAVALLASYAPARRATRVDPITTLRSQ